MSRRLALVIAAALALSGCHRKEITSLQRKEAANLVSEAEFAATLRDWSRAEGLYVKASGLCPDEGDLWLNLGIMRMHLHDSSGARSAYKSALSAYEDESDLEPANSRPIIRRVYVLVLLGRADEAKSLVNKAASKNPDDRLLRSFIESQSLDRMVADPGVKELTP